MTNSFAVASIIGRGGFGPVYKGQNGAKEIAVKRNSNEAMAMAGGQGRREYDRELQTLRMCRHEGIVPLLGSCNQEGHPLCLVYPFMANGSLFDALLPSSSVHLDAAQRIDIALGTARGLRYLHTAETDAFHDKPSIIHRDIKSANILLDSQLRARICDVGLAREADSDATMTGGVGTPGYVDPEYHDTLEFTTASDVFSFGVVLVELLTGCSAVDRTQRPPVLHPRARAAMPAVDSRVAFSQQQDHALRELGRAAISTTSDGRPSTDAIIERLTMASGAGGAPQAVARVRECVVCMDEPPRTRFLPCHHSCACEGCARAFARAGSTCPICRSQIASFDVGDFTDTLS
jgi:serine/threonine protein kinase